MTHQHLHMLLDLWRPGGGQSYSGGGGGGGGYSGGGGGGGGGGGSSGGGAFLAEVIWALIQVCFRYPPVGIAVLATIVFAVVVSKLKGRSPRGWSSPGGSWEGFDPTILRQPTISLRRQLGELRKVDPAFSTVLFEDFLYALYARVAEARGMGGAGLRALAPWLAEPARAQAVCDVPVTAIVIGALRYRTVDVGGDRSYVTVEIEANYTEGQSTYYTTETWSLARPGAARSRPPDKTRDFECPNCGASLIELRGPVCQHCQATVVDTGLDWVVESISIGEKSRRAPALTGDVVEVGTNFPTVFAPDLAERLGELRARDPAFSESKLDGRVRLVFDELQVGWSTRDWARVRPFVSDGLFQMQLYWIETYRRAGLTNQTAGGRVDGVELCAVESDAHFDAATLRVRASSLDFTTRDGDGKIVSGSRKRRRDYTEYWTFIRGSARRGAPSLEKKCPSCGAELKINMAGSCEYCKARVGSGEFDWVLSRIEQDDSYGG